MTDIIWRKSRYSNPNGACVELASWRKSSHSDYQGCAEIGSGVNVVGVRDTKQAHLGDQRTVLEFSPDAWRRFTQEIKTDLVS